MGTLRYARWAEPPSEMIGDFLLVNCAPRAAISMCIPCERRSRRLSACGHLTTSARSPERSRARVAFEFELHDSKTGATVWSGSYAHDEPVAERNV